MLKKIKLTVPVALEQWQLLRRMSEDRRQATGSQVAINSLIVEAIQEMLDNHGYRPLSKGEQVVKIGKE